MLLVFKNIHNVNILTTHRIANKLVNKKGLNKLKVGDNTYTRLLVFLKRYTMCIYSLLTEKQINFVNKKDNKFGVIIANGDISCSV